MASEMGIVEIVTRARCYVYRGGGIKSLPDEVITELSGRNWMMGQGRVLGDETAVTLSIRHADRPGRVFLDAGDSILFLDDDRLQDFESVKVEWAVKGEGDGE